MARLGASSRALLLALLIFVAHGRAEEDNDDDGADDSASDAGSNPAESDSDSNGDAGAGGGFNMNGLQSALKDGGVGALTSMLSAMGKAQHHTDADFHIKKDSNGEEVYDFTNLDQPAPTASSTPTPPVTVEPASTNVVAPAPPAVQVMAAKPEAPPAAPQLRGNAPPPSLAIADNDDDDDTSAKIDEVAAVPDGRASLPVGGDASAAAMKVMQDMASINSGGDGKDEDDDGSDDLLVNLKALTGSSQLPKQAVTPVAADKLDAPLLPKALVVPVAPKAVESQAPKRKHSGHHSHKHHAPHADNRHTSKQSSQPPAENPPMTTTTSPASTADAQLPVSDLSKGLLAVKHGVDALLNGANEIVREGSSTDGAGDQSTSQSKDLLSRIDALENANEQQKEEERGQAVQIAKLSDDLQVDHTELKEIMTSDKEPSLQLDQVANRHRHRRVQHQRHAKRARQAALSQSAGGVQTFWHLKVKNPDN